MGKKSSQSDTLTVEFGVEEYSSNQLGSVLELIRAERRALVLESQAKYATKRAVKAQERKQALKTKRKVQGLYGACILVILGLIWSKYGHQDITSEAEHFQEPAKISYSVAQLNQIERRIRSRFLSDDWRFHGASAVGPDVMLYVELPEPLDLEINYQVDYIKRTLCPKPGSEIWGYIAPKNLFFHLYDYDISDAVSANCALSGVDKARS